uniref:N-acetylmuramidase domain-containing protein n=1 Tax=Marinobacterium profundum TaxID=1714300 RepID=UPI00082F3039|nr:N-acetylmuramidase domain-containing protein [Marinobacterium profundum]
MNFQSKGKPLSDSGLEQICDTLGVGGAEVWAVLSVETRGFGFLENRKPRILFERHIFHRRTDGAFDQENPNISNSAPGAYSGGPAEYARLEAAMQLNTQAALESASWGIGQVMGFNYAVAGYADVNVMVDAMVADEDSQILAMAHFIKGNNLATAMQRKNWEAFARGYNGPAFRKNDYDVRLAAAHARFRVALPNLGLRTAQAALLFLGFDPGPVDGVRGRRTRSGLVQFQERFGLNQSGELDQATEQALSQAAFGD